MSWGLLGSLEMILYYGVTTYQFFCFMVHKLSEKKKEKAVLLLPERINDADLLTKNILKTEIFSDVIKYKEIFPKAKIVDSKVIESAIKDSIDLVKDYNIDFSSYDDLYIASDHYSLGVFLTINNIKYNFFEEGNGRLSSSEDVYEHLAKINPIRAQIAKKLKLFGFSENVIHRYGNLNAIKNDDYYDSRDINFDVSERLATLSSMDIEKIFFAFGVSKESFSNIIDSKIRKQILLTQHYINMGLLTYEGQISLYRNLLDYFGDNNASLVIKPHPSDIHVDYNDVFPDSIVLPRTFPAELLTVLNLHFSKGIAASSTSINSFSKISEEIICFDQRIESDVNNFSKYFVCGELLKKIKVKELNLIGVNELLLNKFAPIAIDKNNGKKVWVVDKPAINAFRIIQDVIAEASEDNSIIVFLDTNNNSYFINNHKIDRNAHILPIAFEQQRNTFQPIREFIYIYSKFPEFMSEILYNMKIEKKLKYSGIAIKSDPEKDLEIKIYEGINIALENRLADVTNAYKKLIRSREKQYATPVKPKIDCAIENCENSDHKPKAQLRFLEKLIVRIFTIGNERKFRKYQKNREQYFRDGWFYRKFMK